MANLDARTCGRVIRITPVSDRITVAASPLMPGCEARPLPFMLGYFCSLSGGCVLGLPQGNRPRSRRDSVCSARLAHLVCCSVGVKLIPKGMLHLLVKFPELGGLQPSEDLRRLPSGWNRPRSVAFCN